MKKKTLFAGILILAVSLTGYFELIGDNETYERISDNVPVIGDSKENKVIVTYEAEQYSDMRLSTEYVKLANVSTGEVVSTYPGPNRTYDLSGLDRTEVMSFSADDRYIVLISFDLKGIEDKELVYNEIDSMRYREPVDFSNNDSLDITIDITGAETGDTLIYSPQLDYQRASRSLN